MNQSELQPPHDPAATPPTVPQTVAPTARPMAKIRLTVCPSCGYSLQGLGESGNCPECGMAFDPMTIVIKGIPRAISTMPWHRKLLWMFVLLVGTFGLQIIAAAITSANSQHGIILGAIGCVWGCSIIYLLMTGKREKKGVESFIFSRGGFCSAANLNSNQPHLSTLTSWRSVRTFRIDKLGSRWHRLRLADSGHIMGHLGSVKLDVNLFLTQNQVESFREHLTCCIRQTHEKTPRN